MDNLKWYEKPVLLSAVQCNYGEDSFDIMRNHVIENNFTGEQLLHVNAVGHCSSYVEETDGGKLDNYLAKAKENNLREILYWNVHCVYEETIVKHLDWKQKDRAGNDIIVYGNQFLICINSSWQNTYLENLEKLCKHKLDGLFLDGPVFMHNGCYCEACQKKFNEKFHKSLFDATYHEFLQFRSDSVTEMIKNTFDMKEKLNNNIKLYINNSALRADVTGSNTTKVYPYVDFLGTEGGFCHINKGFDYTRTTSHAKFIESKANGKPYVIFIAGDAKPYSYMMHTETETKRLYQLSLAQGANIWYGIHGPTKMMHAKAGRAVKKLNQFILDNEHHFIKTKSNCNIGLLWSDATANYYKSSIDLSDFTKEQVVGDSDKKGDHHESLLGFVDILTRGHNQYDILDQEKILDQSIFKYETIILPTYACMSEKEAIIIKEYVKTGGRIIATYDTGMYDELGNKRNNGILDDICGIKRNKVITYSGTGVAYGEFIPAIEENIFPHSGSSWEIEVNDKVNVLGKVSYEMAGRYVAYPEEFYPCMVENTYGKGTVLYISSTISEVYFNWCNPNLRSWIQEQIDQYATKRVVTNAPQSVEISMRRQDHTNSSIIHIVNMTRGPGRPMEETIAVGPIELLCTNVKASSVTGIYTNKEYKFSNTSKGLEIIIDKLDDYEVLIIKEEE